MEYKDAVTRIQGVRMKAFILSDRTFLDDTKQMIFGGETLEVSDGQGRIALMEMPEDSQLIRYQLKNHLESIALELGDHAQLIF